MAEPIAVSDKAFEEEVEKADKPVLVDFWAEWCTPCRMVAPVVEEIATEKGDSLKVAKVNVDENPMIANKFGISSIPTLILFKDGKPVERLVGFMPKGKLVGKLDPHL
ncbi:MAG: thioredoxin [Chloroflexi bacterium]|nr:thioredoxin [Chloroflexota bacterium]